MYRVFRAYVTGERWSKEFEEHIDALEFYNRQLRNLNCVKAAIFDSSRNKTLLYFQR